MPDTAELASPPAQAPAPAVTRRAAAIDDPQRVRRLRFACTTATLLLFFVVVPLLSWLGVIEPSNLNRLGRYLAYALVALGVDLIWGYTGMLSLCQALFFCLGGYAVGMHLSLAEGGGNVLPEFNRIPAFFFYNDITSLPAFWQPFRSRTLTIIAGLAVPTLFAALLGWFIFRSRVKGVYFSIITQALAWAALLAFTNHRMLMGGTNGLSNFHPPLNNSFAWILGLYLASATAVLACYLAARHLVASRAGRVLVAIRDNESRLRFSGFQPTSYKVFVFAVGACFAALGGMLYTPQNGVIGPSNMSIDWHILMVIWVAVGGRGRLWGAILGALVVNYSYALMTSDMPYAWPFVQGALFLAVVLLFPDGFVKLWDRFEEHLRSGRHAWSAVLPLALVLAFLLVEGLGLVRSDSPATRLWTSDLLGLRGKYWALLLLLVPAIVIDVLLTRRSRPASAGPAAAGAA